MNTLKEILSGFDSISLEEASNVHLMNRTDIKYIFHRLKLNEILQQLSSDYKVLEINDNRINDYQSLYFDTASHYLYLQHHNSILNRYKIRYRHYASSGDCFFEIKCKNNKNRTIKNRVTACYINEYIDENGINLIKANTTLDASKLQAVLWVNFSRITLVNRNLKERLTIDTEITFKENNKIVAYPEIVIAEVKQDNFSFSPYNLLMKKMHIRTGNISKYCFGLISTQENIKMNNFKHKLMTIKKIYNEI
ncbi:MAG: polyphosphate polymerase domain-containing protein [Bacteroidales bacterium]